MSYIGSYLQWGVDEWEEISTSEGLHMVYGISEKVRGETLLLFQTCVRRFDETSKKCDLSLLP